MDRLLEESIQALQDLSLEGAAEIFDVSLKGTSLDRTVPVCGGTMRLLLDPTAARDRASYREAARAPAVPHPALRYSGDIILMTKEV